MKQNSIACFVIMLICIITSNNVWAHGGGGHGGGGHFGGGGQFGGGHFGGGHFGGHHGGWGFSRGFYGLGFGFGPGYYGGYYPFYGGYGGYYGYPPVVTVPAIPPVYIQQSPSVAQQYQSGYWYYCSNPEGYYPYIKECLTSWQQVEPRPSGPR